MATPALTCPHPAASPPTMSPLQSPLTPMPPQSHHSCPHPANAATNPANTTSTPPQPPPPCPQATHLAAASTQSVTLLLNVCLDLRLFANQPSCTSQ